MASYSESGASAGCRLRRGRYITEDAIVLRRPLVEFLEFTHAWELLAREGVVTLTGEEPLAGDHLQLDYGEAQTAWRIIFGAREGYEPDINNVETLDIARERAGELLTHILHKLHISPVFLFPIGVWRDIFDVATHVLLENAEWMELDTASAVKLNKRDPLRVELRDLATVHPLIDALLANATTLNQGISIAAITAPLLFEIDANGGVLVTA